MPKSLSLVQPGLDIEIMSKSVSQLVTLVYVCPTLFDPELPEPGHAHPGVGSVAGLQQAAPCHVPAVIPWPCIQGRHQLVLQPGPVGRGSCYLAT